MQLWPQLSKVLKLVRWARRILFPPVSLQQQVVRQFDLLPMHLIQERAYTVSWVVQIKVVLQQPLTCDSSFMLPTCFPHSPPHSPTFTSIILLLLLYKCVMANTSAIWQQATHASPIIAQLLQKSHTQNPVSMSISRKKKRQNCSLHSFSFNCH